jgi:uncharacterized protein YgiM (DUF1202 family)
MFTQEQTSYTVTIPPAGNTSGWPGQAGRNRIALASDFVFVRDTPNVQGAVMATMHSGEEVDLGKVITGGGAKWCMVTLRDGRSGYIPAETKVRSLKFVSLLDSFADMRSAIGAQAPVIRRLVKGNTFLLLGTVEGGFVKVRDANGQEGYIDGKVKINQASGTAPASSAQHDMMVGGLWCLGGILVTALTYNMASESGGHYFIAWGAILFGGIQFLRGLFRLGS